MYRYGKNKNRRQSKIQCLKIILRSIKMIRKVEPYQQGWGDGKYAYEVGKLEDLSNDAVYERIQLDYEYTDEEMKKYIEGYYRCIECTLA